MARPRAHTCVEPGSLPEALAYTRCPHEYHTSVLETFPLSSCSSNSVLLAHSLHRKAAMLEKQSGLQVHLGDQEWALEAITAVLSRLSDVCTISARFNRSTATIKSITCSALAVPCCSRAQPDTRLAHKA